MKRRYLIIVFVIALLTYWFANNESVDKRRRGTEVAEEAENPNTNGFHVDGPKNSASLLTSESSPKLPTTNSEPPDPNEECWKKIRARFGIEPNSSNLRTGIVASADGVIGRWFFSKEESFPREPEPSAPGGFMYAMARAGLLYEQDDRQIEKDIPEAIEVLKRVASQDPENSAPLIYAALLEDSRGNVEESQRLLIEARKTKRFNTYWPEITLPVFRSVRTPAEVVDAIGLWSNSPAPDYLALSAFLKKNKDETIANQLVAPVLEKNSTVDTFRWMGVEYAFGRSILKNVKPELNLPSYSEMAAIVRSRGPTTDTYMDLVQKNCDPNDLEPFVKYFQSL